MFVSSVAVENDFLFHPQLGKEFLEFTERYGSGQMKLGESGVAFVSADQKSLSADENHL